MTCLYCAVAVLVEKMKIEQEVSVVNTLRQIKARRRSAIPNIVSIIELFGKGKSDIFNIHIWA